jgi:peptide/nickel transport system substrate-binding protein
MRRWVGTVSLAAAALACGRASDRPARPAHTSAVASPAVAYVDESERGKPADGGTLYRRLEGEPATLNPILQTSDYETYVLADVTRNLVDFDKNLNPVGGLCARWEVSDGGRTYTFHLRPEAVWEDGAPVTSRDAVFTIRRIADPKVPAVLFSSYFEGLEGVSALDPKTFRVAFREPYAFRLYAFNFPLLPAALFEKEDLLRTARNRTPVSNGPYRFVRWETSDSIELARNERYWGPRAHFDRVVLRILPDSGQAYRALLEGSLDEMRLGSEQWKGAMGDARFQRCCRVTMFYDLSFFYLGYNNKSPLFSDVLTRRALGMMLDRDALIRDLYYGTARALSGPWAANSPVADPTIAPDPFDPAAARELLARAGWKDSDGDGVLDRGGKRLDFELLYPAGEAVGRQTGEVFKEQLGKIGVVCRPRPLEAAALFKRMDAGDFEAVVSSWSADPNPDPYPNWYSSQAPPNGLNNLSYSDPEADRLLEAARREFDPVKRRALFHRLARVIHDDAPATFGLQGAQKLAVSKRIGGLVTTPIGAFKFWPDSAAWWGLGPSPP